MINEERFQFFKENHHQAFKYITFKNLKTQKHFAIVFGAIENHNYQAFRFTNMFPDFIAVSAGFVNIGKKCYGDSYSLKLKSNIEDNKHIDWYTYEMLYEIAIEDYRWEKEHLPLIQKQMELLDAI